MLHSLMATSEKAVDSKQTWSTGVAPQVLSHDASVETSATLGGQDEKATTFSWMSQSSLQKAFLDSCLQQNTDLMSYHLQRH